MRRQVASTVSVLAAPLSCRRAIDHKLSPARTRYVAAVVVVVVVVVGSPLIGANGSRGACTGTTTGASTGRGRRNAGGVCSSVRTFVCTTGAGAAVPIVLAI